VGLGRAALAVAAYRQMAGGDLPLPDTGTIRDDTLELLRRANRAWSSPVGSVQRNLLAGVADDPQLLAWIQGAPSHAERRGPRRFTRASPRWPPCSAS
jgi:hypothetical protein